jgi:hypothetical protein
VAGAQAVGGTLFTEHDFHDMRISVKYHNPVATVRDYGNGLSGVIIP